MTKQELRESLNKRDIKALTECNDYYDLVNTYEIVKSSLQESDLQKLESLVSKRNNDTEVNDFLNSFLGEDFIREEEGQLDESELNLNRIYESEELAESEELDEAERTHRINVEKCYAKASGNPYYSLKDIDTGDFIGKKQRVSYKSKEKAKEKLHNMKTGQDDSYIDYSSDLIVTDEAITENSEVKQEVLTEGQITKGPFEVTIYYDDSKHKYRAKADDGIHGLANCRFPNALRDRDCIYIVSQLDWLGDQYNVPSKVILGEKSEMATKDMEDAGTKFDDETAEFSDDFFEGLNEASDDSEFIPSDIIYQFGDREFSEDDISPETLQMIKTPLKKNGEPWAETVAILRIYDHLINRGERRVSREQILRESGVANWNRQGEHSTWFTELDILGIASISDNDVVAGPNLRGWVEGTVQPVGIWRKRDGSRVQIGPGNPGGTDLRPFIGNNVKTRADQGLQPDRSHGKGDTKTLDTNLKSSGITFDGNTAEFPDNYFESLNEEDIEMSQDDIIDKRTKKINKLYRKYMSLEEDAEVNEENINDWGVGHVCSMNGWDEDCVRKALLNK